MSKEDVRFQKAVNRIRNEMIIAVIERSNPDKISKFIEHANDYIDTMSVDEIFDWDKRISENENIVFSATYYDFYLQEKSYE